MAKNMATDENSPTKPQPLSRLVMHLTTSAILFGNISFGCSSIAYAPALGNIAGRYKTTIADIAIVFTIVSMTTCIGAIISILKALDDKRRLTKQIEERPMYHSTDPSTRTEFSSGILSKYVNRQLIVIISLFAMASSMFLTPYCPTKMLFFVCGGVFGLSAGFYGLSQVVWIIEIWQEKAGPFIQAQHFCLSFGSIVPSAVLAPFLNKYEHSHAINAEPVLSEESSIHIPFLIIGTFNSLALLFQLFLFSFYRYHTPPMYADENVQQLDDAKFDSQSTVKTELSEHVSSKQRQPATVKVKKGISSRKIQLVAFAILFLSAYQAMETSTMQFLPIFGQYSDLKLSESDAAHVLTGLMAMYATGRLVGIIIIFKVRPELIVAVNLLLITMGNTILSVWASASVIMFWIGSMMLGAGISTMFPSFFTFIEKHLIISSIFASSTMIFGATASAIYPIILGKFIEQQAVVLTYSNFGSTFVCAIVMFWGYYLTRTTVARE